MQRKRRLAAVGLAATIAGAAVPAVTSGAQPSATATICTNPVSGTSWGISIDYAKATVDSHPAEISTTAISWFDPSDGGRYSVDRETGKMTASFASSTGGYFLYARCRLPGPQ